MNSGSGGRFSNCSKENVAFGGPFAGHFSGSAFLRGNFLVFGVVVQWLGSDR